MSTANDHLPRRCMRTSSCQRILLVLGATLFVSAPFVYGQVFQIDGGASSLFQASGGSVHLFSPTYQGWAGAGLLAGELRWGAFFSEHWRSSTLAFGDQVIPLRLPTDIFDSSHYFLGRGASVAIKNEHISIFGFAGATSIGFGAPFFTGAQAENKVGALFLDANLSPQWRIFSQNIISDLQTSVSGVEWHPQTGIVAALSGGLGSNHRYAGASFKFDRPWISLKTAYVTAGTQFRRVVVENPSSSENDRENIQVTLRPTRFLDFAASRLNFLQPTNQNTTVFRALVNQYSASVRADEFTLRANLFDSTAQGISMKGTSLSLGRDFANRIRAEAYWSHSRAPGYRTTSMLASLQEVISARLSLLQEANHSSAGTSFSWGGDFVSNPVSIGIAYETIYSPLSPGNPFRQALILNLRLQPRGSAQVNVGSFVTPDGSVKYTAYATAFPYAGESRPNGPPVFRFPRYMVRGEVTDEEGRPVSGAAFRIGKEIVFTNINGEFFVRSRKAHPARVEPMLDSFLAPGQFEVVSCPPTVKPSLDPDVSIQIVLRRRKDAPKPASPPAG